MKYLLIVLLINLLMLGGVYGQTKKKIWDENEIGNVSVFLNCQINDSTFSSGTGTIIYYENQYYLLTASHVSKNMDEKSIVVFRIADDRPYVKQLNMLTLNSVVKWRHHDIADIAIIELKLPVDSLLRSIYTELAFPLTQVYGGQKLPARDADITFLGYPVLDPKYEYFSALSFSSSLSSGLITQERADTKQLCAFFYLKSPSIQSCSGSGVYYGIKKLISVKSSTIMIGVMHGTYSDNTGGKMAMVTPAFYIGDFFKK